MQLKKLSAVHTSSEMHWVGDGFPVRSVFSYNDLGEELSPFLLLDYAAPYEFAPTSDRRGVGAHPHKGFETVTIAYQGEVAHRDSGGGGGVIGPGDVQWMTAGRGVIHEEFHSKEFAKRGGTFQMVQLWVNLRAAHKSAAPKYQTLPKAEIPTADLPSEVGWLRIIAGEYDGQVGPAQTFTPIDLWDVQTTAGAAVHLPAPDSHTTTFLVIEGSVTLAKGQQARPGDLVIFERKGEAIEFETTAATRILLMGGEPIDEPIAGRGPFVMNSESDLQQAFEEYRAGAMGRM